jgi:hypothetical protein
VSAAATTAAPATRSQPAAGPGYWRGMLWLTWRQHRWPILVGTAVTVGMLVWMTTTASEINSGLALCRGLGVHCPRTTQELAQIKLDHGYSFATYQLNTIVVLPVLLGLFWGVPVLAREYEQRTLVLAWSQGISPQKWLWGKLAILGFIVVALSAAVAGTAEHLAYLAHLAGGRSLFEGTLFQGGGWMPFTLALGWFACGVAVGAIVRRTMPALATVIGLFVLRTVLMVKYRPELMTPVTTVKSIVSGGSGKYASGPDLSNATYPGKAVNNAMSLTGGNDLIAVDANGHSFAYSQIMNSCVVSYNKPGDPSDSYMQQCIQQHGIVGFVDKYQPASRLGTFHLIENSLNLGLMVASLVVTWWFVRKSRTTQ